MPGHARTTARTPPRRKNHREAESCRARHRGTAQKKRQASRKCPGLLSLRKRERLTVTSHRRAAPGSFWEPPPARGSRPAGWLRPTPPRMGMSERKWSGGAANTPVHAVAVSPSRAAPRVATLNLRGRRAGVKRTPMHTRRRHSAGAKRSLTGWRFRGVFSRSEGRLRADRRGRHS